MSRMTLNEINDTMEEMPSKLLLVINSIDKRNAKTHQLLWTLTEEVRSNRNQNNAVEQVLKTISNNSAGISRTIQEGFQGVENRNIVKGKIDTLGNKPFFNITKIKILQRCSQNYSRKILRKCQGKFYQNTKRKQKETAVRQQLSLEKFNAEINLKKIRSQKYLEHFQTLDAHMITHFTMNYDNDIYKSLTELWENNCL